MFMIFLFDIFPNANGIPMTSPHDTQIIDNERVIHAASSRVGIHAHIFKKVAEIPSQNVVLLSAIVPSAKEGTAKAESISIIKTAGMAAFF